MLPAIAGARPGKINMMSSPRAFSSLRLPDRKPSPRPTRSRREPTPQAMPNIVRNERSLFAHRVRNICRRISKNIMPRQGLRSNLRYADAGCLVPQFYQALRWVLDTRGADSIALDLNFLMRTPLY